MKAFPNPLTPAEEKKYIQRYTEGDLEAKHILIERNLRLVAHVIRKYQNTSEDPEDLISIGTIGLIKAVITFDPEKGNRLAAYASRCVENEVLMYLRARKKCSHEISLYEPIGTDREGNEVNLYDIIESTETDIPERIHLKDNIQKLYEKLENELSPREKLVLKMRYGLYLGEEYTQREIAAQLGISRSYVSRRGYCKRGGGCLRGPGRPGRRRHPHCGVRAGKASFSEGGPECRTCGRHQHQWYSQLSGYRRYPATRSMNTLLEGLRVRCRPARVSRRLWSSSFQQSPITVRTARSTAIEVVWNCLAVSR